MAMEIPLWNLEFKFKIINLIEMVEKLCFFSLAELPGLDFTRKINTEPFAQRTLYWWQIYRMIIVS